MKRLFLFFIFFSRFTSVMAQLDKGTWMAGGAGSFRSTRTSFENSTVYLASDHIDISLSAHLGFFVFDKLVTGLKPSYEKFKEKSDGGGYSNTNRYGLGPFARYYFLNKDKQFNILTDVSYQYGLYRFRPSKGNINTFSANAGLTGFFNTSVAIEFLAGYYFRKESTSDPYISMQKGFQMSVGFQFYLEK